jgi:hypothetical protein
MWTGWVGSKTLKKSFMGKAPVGGLGGKKTKVAGDISAINGQKTLMTTFNTATEYRQVPQVSPKAIFPQQNAFERSQHRFVKVNYSATLLADQAFSVIQGYDRRLRY